MTALDAVVTVGLVGFFLAMSSGVAASVGAAARPPPAVPRFIVISAAGERVAPEHAQWLGVVGLWAVALAAVVKDRLTAVDSTHAVVVSLERATDAGRILDLLVRRAQRARRSDR
jgi:hypothetical protein